MAGFRVRVWFDPDGLDIGQPGMELADDAGQVAVIRRVILLHSPGPDGAVAVLVCTPS